MTKEGNDVRSNREAIMDFEKQSVGASAYIAASRRPAAHHHLM
jgi:hypothetical protein